MMPCLLFTVPPRIPSSRPLISHQYPDRLTLSWMPARVPSYVKNQRLTYIVEVREPPSTLWRSLIDDLRDTEFDVTDLNPEQDYLFRVRAKNEYGLSEPTMPASVIRDRGTCSSFFGVWFLIFFLSFFWGGGGGSDIYFSLIYYQKYTNLSICCYC